MAFTPENEEMPVEPLGSVINAQAWLRVKRKHAFLGLPIVPLLVIESTESIGTQRDTNVTLDNNRSMCLWA